MAYKIVADSSCDVTDKMKRENPEYQKQIMDMEEGLANTQCYQFIQLQRFPRRTEDINISSPIDGI